MEKNVNQLACKMAVCLHIIEPVMSQLNYITEVIEWEIMVTAVKTRHKNSRKRGNIMCNLSQAQGNLGKN